MSNSKRSMPGKLIVVLVLLGVSIGLNLLASRWLAGAIGGLILAGVVSGNNSVRQLLIVLGWLGLAFGVVSLVLSGMVALHGFTSAALGIVALTAYGAFVNGYFIWAMQREDVRDWMFRKSMNLDALESET